jgi:photosystem II stability/assembly factor-like uncharacterized protein
MTRYNSAIARALPLVAYLTTQVGCRQNLGNLSPSYSNETAPRIYAFRNVTPDLNSVFGTSDGKRLWAVGAKGTILESSDGDHWNVRTSGTTSDLNAVFGTSDGKRLWVVGQEGTILESSDGEHWNARTSGTTEDLNSVFGTSDGKRLWAVTARGTILESSDGEHWNARTSGTPDALTSVFGTSDGKRLWTVTALGTILESSDGEHWNARTSGATVFLNSVFGTSDGKRLWAVGGEGTILESSDGEHWNARTSRTTSYLNSVFGTSDGKRLWVVGQEGTILESSDGERWNARTSGTTEDLKSVFGTSDGKRLWAVGAKGTILESRDGEHWNARTSGTTSDLNAVFGTSDGKRLWAVGGEGTILESSDGEHWNARTSGTTAFLTSVFGTSDGKRLWAVDIRGTMLESSDGEHWNARTSGTPKYLTSVFGTSDGKRLWAVGEKGKILESSDGEHWNARTSGTTKSLFSVFGTSDGKRLWAVGEDGTMLEASDGEHWNARTSGTTQDLNSVFGTSDGKRLWAVGGVGTILESRDGEHWNALTSGTTKHLTSVFGTSDGKRLWVVGDEGTILESSDGEHWNARTSGTSKYLASVFGTSDGKRLWAVGRGGTILEGINRKIAPFIRDANLRSEWASTSLKFDLDFESPSDVQSVNVAALNEYDFQKSRSWPEQVACAPLKKANASWQCSIDKSTLQPEVTPPGLSLARVHIKIEVNEKGGRQIYDFVAPFDPWSPITQHPIRTSIASTILVLFGFPSVLLFIRPLWNLRLYRALKLSRIEKIDIPGVGGVAQLILRLVAVLPWFIQRRRTLDAWVWENRERMRKAWDSEVDSGVPEVYVPLPIRLGDASSGVQTMQPGLGDFKGMIAEPRATILIIGPGGAGKTTFARQLGRWAFEIGEGTSPRPMLPLWVDEELDQDKKSLPAVVRGKLTAALPNEEIDDVLFSALLEKQRLMVIFDRLSERSATTQGHLQTIYRSARIGLLVITSRTEHRIDGAPAVKIYPQPLNSATLLRFMTELLRLYLGDSEGSRPFSSIKEQIGLGERLAELISLRTESGEEDLPLNPLPVRLFVEQAVVAVREGKQLDDLPVSLPEVYFRHLRLVNPQDSSLPHFVDSDRMLKVAKILGKLAIGANFIPTEFTRDAARAELLKAGETVTPGCDPVERLKLNGVLVEKQGGLNVRLRFALDPIAEFLAAAAWGEECGNEKDKWEQLLRESQAAPGFQSALKLVRQAYW